MRKRDTFIDAVLKNLRQDFAPHFSAPEKEEVAILFPLSFPRVISDTNIKAVPPWMCARPYASHSLFWPMGRPKST